VFNEHYNRIIIRQGEMNMKYNLSEIMKRAWEIKERADRNEINRISNIERKLRELKQEEKALFSECLRTAWKEVKRAEEIADEYGVKEEESQKMSKKETELKAEGHYGITWNIWTGYGYRRAYYKCADNSKYQNSKKYNYVDIAA